MLYAKTSKVTSVQWLNVLPFAFIFFETIIFETNNKQYWRETVIKSQELEIQGANPGAQSLVMKSRGETRFFSFPFGMPFIVLFNVPGVITSSGTP
jgi:hypothetical protein